MCDNQFGELKYFKTKKIATNRDQLAKTRPWYGNNCSFF